MESESAYSPNKSAKNTESFDNTKTEPSFVEKKDTFRFDRFVQEKHNLVNMYIKLGDNQLLENAEKLQDWRAVQKI